jgi:SAM-dependent methyltransferase
MDAEIAAYYARGEEAARLTVTAAGVLEFERTKEIILRRLPPAPALVADIGGGPGRYSQWLAGLGYEVEHRDLMPLHVEQLREELAQPRDDAAQPRDGAVQPGTVRTAVGDACAVDLPDASVDAVLLLGPLYHLKRRADRIAALAEARRILRPGGPLFAAAISRWAPRLDGELRGRLYEQFPEFRYDVVELERTGWGRPFYLGAFTAYYHRPAELRQEVRSAGLTVSDLVCVEGAAVLLGDLAERLADPDAWEVVLETARALERVPELLGIGPHLIVTAVRQEG